MDPKVGLILIHNPFDPYGSRDIRALPYRVGAAVPEYLAPIAPADEYVVSLNGGLIHPAVLAQTIPCPGDQLVVCPLVEKGGGGKDVLRVIAMIVVMIVAGAISGGALGPAGLALLGEGFAAGGAGAFGLGIAVALGGSMLVNALLPPAKMDSLSLSGLGGDLAGSATYGWNGPQTMCQPGITIPVLYGTTKIAGNVIQHSAAAEGDDKYANLLLALKEERR
jgi:predicted phage tail protein